VGEKEAVKQQDDYKAGMLARLDSSSIDCKHSLLVTTFVNQHELMTSNVTTVGWAEVKSVWQRRQSDDRNSLTTASHVDTVRYRVNDVDLQTVTETNTHTDTHTQTHTHRHRQISRLRCAVTTERSPTKKAKESTRVEI